MKFIWIHFGVSVIAHMNHVYEYCPGKPKREGKVKDKEWRHFISVSLHNIYYATCRILSNRLSLF